MLDTSTLFWNATKASLQADEMASSRIDIRSCTAGWYGSKLVRSIDTARSVDESNQEVARQSERSRYSGGLAEGHKCTKLDINPPIKPDLILTI